jgi:hypothetical protein
MLYSTLLTIAGLRAKAVRAEARAEASLPLSPKMVLTLLDDVERQLPAYVTTSGEDEEGHAAHCWRSLRELRAETLRAEAQAESLTLTPSRLWAFLDDVEQHLPQMPTPFIYHGMTLPEHVLSGVLRDLTHDNRVGALRRLRLHLFGSPTSEGASTEETMSLLALVEAIEADAQEGSQNSA